MLQINDIDRDMLLIAAGKLGCFAFMAGKFGMRSADAAAHIEKIKSTVPDYYGTLEKQATEIAQQVEDEHHANTQNILAQAG